MSTLSLKIEFGGGLELLFDNKRSHRLAVPARIPASWSLATRTAVSTAPNPEAENTKTRPVDVRYLIYWLNDNLLRERSELFVEDGTVRPGILVLINDTDWELEGECEYELKDGDEVVFISTLHGG